MVESYLLPKLFMKFRDANPDIILDVQECKNSNDVQEKIDQDFLDFGIIFLRVDENLKNSLQLVKWIAKNSSLSVVQCVFQELPLKSKSKH